MTELLHDLISQSANQTPDAIAIEEKNDSINYSKLDQKVTQFSNLLISNNINRGDRVGLIVNKSIRAYIGIYGILKSGAAYVPIDKRAPNDRLSIIIDDCSIDTLVVSAQNLAKVKDLCAHSQSIRQIIVVDDSPSLTLSDIKVLTIDSIEQQPLDDQRDFQIVDADLAYILYTSGSTGKPKGVMINHHTSMSFVKWSCQHAKLNSQDRVSAHAPLHFDLSIFDIYATAMAGATLVPVPDGASTFPSRLLDWIVNNRISVWYSVPSILSMMAQQKNFESSDLSNLRLIIFAGEVFPVPYLKLWLNRLPEVDFMNWFGPTETNVITSYTVNLSADEIDKPIPIGKSTTNADLYCLDLNGDRITEPGQSGELYARGGCVALGYWGDKEKTSQKFLANNESPWLQDRIFKTGDMVLVDNNGDYVFQGRNDHMVKCRGYRIELGEVEAAFFQNENIIDAVVVPIPDDLIGNKLIAFVVTKDSQQLNLPEPISSGDEILLLNKSISQKLPQYMIPSEIKIASQLPHTSNGKIDRQKLTKSIQNTEL